MRQHGRVSEASRAIGGVTELYPQPEPPAELSEPEAVIWRQLCEAMPPNWFRPEMHKLLATLCGEMAQLDLVHAALGKFKALPTGVKWRRYKELTSLRARLASQIAILQTKLRMTPQSWIDPQVAGRAVRGSKQRPAIGAKPWGAGDED